MNRGPRAPGAPSSGATMVGWGTGGKGEGKGREEEVDGREREGPEVNVEPGPLGALLRHCRETNT